MDATVAGSDPGQARDCLRESRELSTALGYQSARDLAWAASIAFLINDQAATLKLGRRAIRGLQWGGDRIRVGLVLDVIAGALVTTRPEAAAIIQAAAEAYVGESATLVQPISPIVTETLGDERARELRARGADMGWDLNPRLHPHPDHPGPQRAQIRNRAMSGLPASRYRYCPERVRSWP